MFGPNNIGGKAVVATLALAASCPALTLAADGTPAAADVGAADEASASPAAISSADSSSSSSMSEIVVTAQKLNEKRAGIETQTGASTYTIDSAAIQAMPGGENTQLNQVILQAPDVAQDSFGQLHVRGEQIGRAHV